MNGDFEVGATGTVTEVDGNRVYAFGHPFYQLGPTQFPMTRARVLTVLPSLAASQKIATTGDVVGIVQQDRATTIAGTLGPGPSMIPVKLTLNSERGTRKSFNIGIVRDQLFTPLLAYVAILNTLTSYERQNGVATYAAPWGGDAEEVRRRGLRGSLYRGPAVSRRCRIRRGPDQSSDEERVRGRRARRSESRDRRQRAAAQRDPRTRLG